MSEELEKPQSIRLKSSQAKKLNKAAAEMALAKQDLIRLTIDFGLKHLEMLNYQLTETIETIVYNEGTFIALRLPNELLSRVKDIERITGLPIATQIYTALTALCLQVERHGNLTLPLNLTEKNGKDN